MGGDAVNVGAVLQHLRDGVAFVGGGHIATAHVFGGGDFERNLVGHLAHLAFCALESEFLQGGKSAAAGNDFVTVANRSHGDGLQKSVRLDACFKIRCVTDFGAVVLRVFVNLADGDDCRFAGEEFFCHVTVSFLCD